MTDVSKKTGYVYAMQPAGMDVVKIGATTDPVRRLATIGAFAPTPTSFRRVLKVTSYRHAHVFEKQLLAWSFDCATHGEWREDLRLVDSLFAEIAPAIDVTSEYPPRKAPATRHTKRDHAALMFHHAVASCEVIHRYQFDAYSAIGLTPATLSKVRTAEDVPAHISAKIEATLAAEENAA